MSTRTASTRTPARRSARARAEAARRRAMLIITIVAATLLALATMSPLLDKAVDELALPLRHDDIIRQQAREKRLDPSLIAAVIYTESRFRDQTSPAGAKGLMQIMPETAEYIARKSGGTAFVQGDLSSPQINIAYGSWYLRYLLSKYSGNEVLALAAYNAGEGKVDEWLAAASQSGQAFDVAEHIPFPETRDYVVRVLEARLGYRTEHGRALGL